MQIHIQIQMHLLKYKSHIFARQQLLGSQCAWTSATATSLTFSRADSKHSSVHSSQSGAEFHPIVCHFHFSTNFSFLIFVASHFRFSSVPFFLLYGGFLMFTITFTLPLLISLPWSPLRFSSPLPSLPLGWQFFHHFHFFPFALSFTFLFLQPCCSSLASSYLLQSKNFVIPHIIS